MPIIKSVPGTGSSWGHGGPGHFNQQQQATAPNSWSDCPKAHCMPQHCYPPLDDDLLTLAVKCMKEIPAQGAGKQIIACSDRLLVRDILEIGLDISLGLQTAVRVICQPEPWWYFLHSTRLGVNWTWPRQHSFESQSGLPSTGHWSTWTGPIACHQSGSWWPTKKIRISPHDTTLDPWNWLARWSLETSGW